MTIRTMVAIVLAAFGASGALAEVPQAGARSCGPGEVLRCVPRTVMAPSRAARLNCNVALTSCQTSVAARREPVTDRYCTCSR